MDNSTVDYIHRKFCTPDTLRCKTWFKRKQRIDRKKRFLALGQERFVTSDGKDFIDVNGLNYTVKEEN
jgi:uncharacterized protein YifE (UPF0438 family)